MTNEIRRCESCMYFLLDHDKSKTGECRRRSPQFYTITQDEPSWDRDTPSSSYVSYSSGWPDVSKDDWCGEYKEVEGVRSE